MSAHHDIEAIVDRLSETICEYATLFFDRDSYTNNRVRSTDALVAIRAQLREILTSRAELLAALRAAEATLAARDPSIVGLPDHPTLVVVRAAIERATS